MHYSLWHASDDVSGLTSPQFAVLHALAHQQPLDQTELGERASLDRSTLANIVTRLSARGFVARTRDAAGARRDLVALTPAADAERARGPWRRRLRHRRAPAQPVSERDRKALDSSSSVRLPPTTSADRLRRIVSGRPGANKCEPLVTSSPFSCPSPLAFPPPNGAAVRDPAVSELTQTVPARTAWTIRCVR